MQDSRNTVPKPRENISNRVPLPSELYTLRELHTHNSRAVTGLEEQLAQAKKARDDVRTRYEDALREVESLESALSASDGLVLLLQRQCTELGKERDRLARLIHPIRRLKDDTLQSIFDWTVELTPSPWRTEMALTLSQVSQSWRKIAFNTQALWGNEIEISLKKDVSLTESRMLFISHRLRSLAPIIILDGIGESQQRGPQILSKLLQAINLNRFKAIELISVKLAHSLDCVQLDQADFKYSSGPLNSLTISSKKESKDCPAWDCGQLLNRFPSVQCLNFYNLGALILGETNKFIRVQTIQLQNILIPTLPSQLVHFSRLQCLSIAGKAFEMESIERDFTLYDLRDFTIRDANGFPWSNFSAPSLRKVSTEVNEEVIQFLCRHSSIRHLQLSTPLLEYQLQSLCIAIPYLDSLDAVGSLDTFLRQTDEEDVCPFPKLTTLHMNILHHPLSFRSFERFVRSRCYTRRVNRQLRKLKRFTILEYATDFYQSGLGSSKLLERCISEVARIESKDGDIVVFQTNWDE